MERLIRLGAVVTTALLTAPAGAVEFSMAAEYEAEYTNNARRSNEGETGEWTHRPGLSVGAAHNGTSVQASVDYRAFRRMHQENLFEDETVITGTAQAVWQAVPERLSFNVSNTRTETTILRSAENTPDNRQESDTSAAGALLRLDSLSSHFMEIGYTYSVGNAEQTETDSQRHIADVGYVVPLSQVRSLHLNLTYEDVDFDLPLAPDYTARRGHLQYIGTTRLLELDLAGGYSTVDRELARDEVAGATGHARLTWNVSPITSVTAAYSRSIDDRSDRLLRGIAEFGEEFDVNSALNEVFTGTDASLTLASALGRTQYSIGAFLRKEDYEDVPRDEESIGANLGLNRALSPTLSLGAYVEWRQNEFGQLARTDDEVGGGLQLTWNRWRRLSFHASVFYGQQDSDREQSDYGRWSGAVGLRYTILGTPRR